MDVATAGGDRGDASLRRPWLNELVTETALDDLFGGTDQEEGLTAAVERKIKKRKRATENEDEE